MSDGPTELNLRALMRHFCIGRLAFVGRYGFGVATSDRTPILSVPYWVPDYDAGAGGRDPRLGSRSCICVRENQP